MSRSIPLTLCFAGVTLLIVVSALWAGAVLWYQLPGAVWLKVLAGVFWLLFALATTVWLWRGSAAISVMAYAVGFAIVLGWWSTIAPLQNRDWADDVSRQLESSIAGSKVTLINVRNFAWRSDADHTARWETREYDLDRVQSVDVAASYWTGPVIAHTLVSFGFDDGRFLTFSIEIRRERGEEFSSVGGFFKKFEVSLVAAEERDILRVRTNVRGEDVYLYRVRLPKADIRSLFRAYLSEADALRQAPRFYNTLTANCTTIVYELARRVVPGLPFDYRLLASGYLPEYLYDAGGLTPGFSMEALRAGGRITDRAMAADTASEADFSRLIRAGMPGG